jgi:anti-sigma28 factor (negative regulator of flagellin synthesis)
MLINSSLGHGIWDKGHESCPISQALEYGLISAYYIFLQKKAKLFLICADIHVQRCNMLITDVNVQANSAEWAKKALSKESSIREEKKAKTGKTAAVYDKVSISADAIKSNSAEALVRARANALPEVREEKIATAKERIESGYYNTLEFSRELADHLAEG